MNWIKATFQRLPRARVIKPRAALVLPLFSPVYTSTTDSFVSKSSNAMDTSITYLPQIDNEFIRVLGGEGSVDFWTVKANDNLAVEV